MSALPTLARWLRRWSTAAAEGPAPRATDALWLFAVALVVRALAAGFGASHFPPADDGSFYHVVATRISAGNGYTWLWPDGAVTFAMREVFSGLLSPLIERSIPDLQPEFEAFAAALKRKVESA